MKKLHTLPLVLMLVCLALFVLVFTACSGSNDTTAEETTTEETTTVESTTTVEVTTTTAITTEAEPEWVNAVFGGGPFVTGGAAVANLLSKTSFNTLMIWSVHLDEETCDLYLNDVLVVQNGELAPKFNTRTWDLIQQVCPNITRIEISVSAWGTKDFEKIKKFIDRDGTGEDTILYKNFKCLIEATHADAVNFDDESLYDVDAMAKFGKMCVDMGAKVTFCPYNSMDFWYQLYNAIGKEHVDRIYVQLYDGGANNNPLDWSRKFGCDIIPGYWSLNGNEAQTKGKKTPAEVTEHLKSYQKCCMGGFMWLFDEMKSHNTQGQYADAIMAAGEGKKWD